MSDGVAVMPDSLAMDTPDEGTLSMDQTQDEATPQEPESSVDSKVDVNIQRISDTEAALKATQRELHEARGELKQLTEMQKSILAPPQEQAKDYLSDESLLEKFVDNPGQTFAEAIRNERAQSARAYVQAFEEFSDELKRSIQGYVSEQLNPERQQLAGQISKIEGEVEGFSSLPAEAKIKLAKLLADKDEAVQPPAGSFAGTGVSQSGGRGTDEYQKKVQSIAQKMFGLDRPAGSELFPDVTGIGSQFKG